MIRARFPRELVEAVKRAAKAAGINPSEFIRKAVEVAVTRKGRPRK
jgi:predicted DNA binding CopG/RHH family protein